MKNPTVKNPVVLALLVLAHATCTSVLINIVGTFISWFTMGFYIKLIYSNI